MMHTTSCQCHCVPSTSQYGEFKCWGQFCSCPRMPTPTASGSCSSTLRGGHRTTLRGVGRRAGRGTRRGGSGLASAREIREGRRWPCRGRSGAFSPPGRRASGSFLRPGTPPSRHRACRPCLHREPCRLRRTFFLCRPRRRRPRKPWLHPGEDQEEAARVSAGVREHTKRERE